jgi:phosphoglycerol transferase
LIKRSFVKNTDYFQSHYVNPHRMVFHAAHPKNLILIYVESLENTYADPALFGRDLLKPLHDRQEKFVSFETYKQMPGTGWTMAAIVSTQCAVPLKTLTLFSNMNVMGQSLQVFLPKAKCLGDILAEQGYTNVFMNGSSLDFSGKGTFLKSHHYTEVYGRSEWIAKGVLRGAEDLNAWGLPDDRMFEQAKIKLSALIKSHKPFNLTLLTVDSHGPSGFINQSCQKKSYHDFKGVISCSAEELSDFINFVKDHGWLDQVDIVILGDHLAMDNPVYDKLQAHSERTIFNMIISPQKLVKNTNTIVHFDLLPTLLDLLGIQYEGNQLGLGYSAISPRFVQPADRLALMEASIAQYSKTYNQLWNL